MNHSVTTAPEHLLQGVWTIDPSESTVAFRVKHFRILTVRGTFPVRSATLKLGRGPTLRGLDATIDATGFTTGNSQRDEDVIGPRFLDTGHFPTIVFHGDRLSIDDNEPRIVGTLTVRDRSRAQTLTIDPRASEVEERGRLRVRAGTTVDRTAYGVDAMHSIVAPSLVMTLDVVFTRAD